MVLTEKLRAVALSFHRKTSVGIHFKNEDAAGVGAVYHPEFSVIVKKRMGIDHVRVIGRIVSGRAAS